MFLGFVTSCSKVRTHFCTRILLFAIQGPTDHRARMCGRIRGIVCKQTRDKRERKQANHAHKCDNNRNEEVTAESCAYLRAI